MWDGFAQFSSGGDSLSGADSAAQCQHGEFVYVDRPQDVLNVLQY